MTVNERESLGDSGAPAPHQVGKDLSPDAMAYARMEASLLAFWVGLARSSPGARVVRVGGIAAAVFPTPGEREVFNNAVAPRWEPLEGSALAALSALYREHGIETWQVWVHEDEREQARNAEVAGLVVDTSTLGMSMPLSGEVLGRGAE